MRFFITELPILPSSAEAPITATAFGCMMRFIWRTISSWLGRRGRGGFGAKSTTMRTSAAIAPSCAGEHRVEIDLGDFGEIGDEPRDA